MTVLPLNEIRDVFSLAVLLVVGVEFQLLCLEISTMSNIQDE